MDKNSIKYTVVKDGNLFVAKAVGIKLASQGKTRQEAIDNLFEAYELFLDR